MENSGLNGVCTEMAFYPKRAAADKQRLWEPGQEITVGFLHGYFPVWEKIVKTAEIWTSYANIDFRWLGRTNDAVIRIAFIQDEGSWSYIGTDCLTVGRNAATMNFSWLQPDTPNTEVFRVVLHEFGHALGMIHEHQNPVAKIAWNKAVVYEAYKNGMGWSKQMVDNNIFKPYDKDITQFTEFDLGSIMGYPIPAKFTTNGFSTGFRSGLSSTDIAFIRHLYPGRAIEE